jgi:hypothetical protein
MSSFHVVKQYGPTRFYAVLADDGSIGFTNVKAAATRFDDADAEAVAAAVNLYTTNPAEVVGAGKEPS